MVRRASSARGARMIKAPEEIRATVTRDARMTGATELSVKYRLLTETIWKRKLQMPSL